MEKDILISCNPPFTNMIFKDKIKFFEFRNRIIKMNVGTKLYFYETKNRKGCGKIVGEAIVDCIYNISEEHTEDIENLCISDMKQLPINNPQKSPSLQLYMQKIGYGGNYAIRLKSVIQYEKPFELNDFQSLKGNVVKHPPMNMMYVTKRKKEDY